MIKRDFINLLVNKAENHIITDLRLGHAYCCVEIDNDKLGLAYTPKELTNDCCSGLGGELYIGQTADKLILNLGDDNRILSCAALASVNALINISLPDLITGDITDIIHLKPTDNIAMIGYFSPLVKTLSKKSNKLCIFEKKTSDNFLPIEQLENLISEFQVALISATSIIDNSIDVLLEITRNCNEVVILGPSTPLSKEVFSKYNVTLLSGMIPVSNTQLKQLISHGYGTRSFKETVKKVSLRIK
ncbi:MAG: DUF364 domain-containing protein [Cyanobacteriota bacterium]